MKIGVYIDPKAALKAGQNKHGYLTVDVDPADLTVEERAVLDRVTENGDLKRGSWPDAVLVPRTLYYGEGGNAVFPLRGMISPTVEELRKALAVNAEQLAEHEAAKKAEAEKRRATEEAHRREYLDADPVTSPKWVNRRYETDLWEVYQGRGDDPEINALREKAKAEADRRNAVIKAEREAKAAENARKTEERQAKKAAGLAKLKAWATEHGSEVTRLRIEEGYDCWVSSAATEVADAVAAVVAGDLKPSPSDDSYDYDVEDRKCPTAAEIKALRDCRRRLQEGTAALPFPATVALARVKATRVKDEDGYDDEEEEPKYTTEVRVTVVLWEGEERERFFSIPAA